MFNPDFLLCSKKSWPPPGSTALHDFLVKVEKARHVKEWPRMRCQEANSIDQIWCQKTNHLWVSERCPRARERERGGGEGMTTWGTNSPKFLVAKASKFQRENYQDDTRKNVGYQLDIKIWILYMFSSSFLIFYLTLPFISSVSSITCSCEAKRNYQDVPTLNRRGKG
jgi:hypothetical protein